LNVSANVTLNLSGSSIVEPKIMKDGVECLDCFIFSYSSSEVKFNVSSWSNYSIEEGALVVIDEEEDVQVSSGGSAPSASSTIVGVGGATSSGEVTLSYGSKLEFVSDGVSYDLFLKNVDRTVDTATLNIVGDGEATLSVGESREIDLDFDGVNDVVVTLNSIDPDKVAVDLELALIGEIVNDEQIVDDEDGVIESGEPIVDVDLKRSFFSRYWYFLVVLFIFVFVLFLKKLKIKLL
jgi:hypothetical protein